MTDIDAIRQQVERYTGVVGSQQGYLAHQLAKQVPALLAKVDELAADLSRRDQDIRDRYEQIARLERHIAGLETQCNEQMHALTNERDALKAGESIPDYKPCVSADCPACEPTEVTS